MSVSKISTELEGLHHEKKLSLAAKPSSWGDDELPGGSARINAPYAAIELSVIPILSIQHHNLLFFEQEPPAKTALPIGTRSCWMLLTTPHHRLDQAPSWSVRGKCKQVTQTKAGQAGAISLCHRGMCCGWDADSATGRQSLITLLGFYRPGGCSCASHAALYGTEYWWRYFWDNCCWALRQRCFTGGCADVWSKSETSPTVRRASRVAVSEALCSADL